jgi:DNA polymerase III subunit delta'
MPFRDVIGHRKLVALLSRSIERDSIPPSLIFAGPAGVGKRLVATASAQALNCLDPRRGTPRTTDAIDYDACGVCAACTRIERGLHPDVVVLEPGDTGVIKTDPVREVIERAGYRPFEGRKRVVIIDQADTLWANAQNALLKTLEEPTSSSVFFLVSARADSLLPTVQSRCVRLRFHELGPEDVSTVLIRKGVDDTKAHAIAALANGSLGAVDEENAEELVAARDDALRLLTRLASTDDLGRRVEAGAKDLLAQSGNLTPAEQREHLAVRLRAVGSLLRDVELVSVNGDRRTLANPDVEASLGRLTAFAGDRGIHAFDTIDEALVAIDRNAGVKIVADWVATQI